MKFYLKLNSTNLQKQVLEEKMIKLEHDDEKIAKEILYHKQMIEIWLGNEKKLRKQMSENQ